MRRLLFSLLVLIAAPHALRAQVYDVAVFGDMPYLRDEAARTFYLPRYHGLLESISKSTVEFAVHLGDYTTGPFCGDSTVNLRYTEFQNLQKPLVLTYGDNDWTDCARGGFNQLERLAKLRQVFTQGNQSLGKVKIPLVRQSDAPQFSAFRENVRWTHGEELFVALHLVGTNNNWGNRERPTDEFVTRNAANLAFLRETFAIAQQQNKRGIAIFIQANPGLHTNTGERTTRATRGFDDFLRELQTLTVSFGKPVVLVHGDTHHFRVDKPLVDRLGHAVPNFTRVEAFGHPNYYWVRLHVDPHDPDLFSVRLVRVETLR